MSNCITDISKKYRSKTGICGGVVIVFNGHVAGWMNKLRSPEHWLPGCIAVDADNNLFKTDGGNEYDGALYWEKLK